MNIRYLFSNFVNSWRHKKNHADFARRIVWIYGSKYPLSRFVPDQIISFAYAPPIGDVKLLVRCNSGSDAFIHGEIFEHNYYDIPLKSIPEKIMDLGSNTGMAAVYFKRLYPDAAIACVEPAQNNVRVLQENLRLNGISAAVFPAAVDTSDGIATIELSEKDYGHRIMNAHGHGASNSVEVESISVPTLLRNLSWDRIDLLKIDIEGHERALLSENCDWLHLVQAICIEWHFDDAEERLQELARTYDFETPLRLAGCWFMERSSHYGRARIP